MTTEREFDQYRFDYESEINRAIAFGGKSHDFYTKVKADVLVEILRQHHGGDAGQIGLLDIGCGNGSLHPFLMSSGLPLTLTGIEVAAEFLEMARKANPGIAYDVYDGTRLPYESGSFDAAFTVCVMHHVPPPNWPAFLAEMHRVVRPGGIVLVFEHNPFNPLTTHIVRTCPLDRNAVLLRPGKLTGLMEAEGLTAIRRRFMLFTPFAARPFRQLDRLLGWLPLGAQYVSYGRVPAAETRR